MTAIICNEIMFRVATLFLQALKPNMSTPCKDCQDAKCSQIHRDYDPVSCKISNGDPCQECCQMAVLDDRISQVHAELVDLAHKRRLLKMKINHLHDPFIHRLPLEISSKIFTTYVDDIDSSFCLGIAKGKLEDWSPALHLSSICVAWRDVARRTAQIWRVIRVPLLRNPVNVKLLTDLTTELFSLSGQHTLSLNLYQDYCDEGLDDDDCLQAHLRRLRSFDDLLNIIRAVISRCSDITIHGLPLEQIQELFWDTDTPNLKKFQIFAPYGQFEESNHLDQFPSGNVDLHASPQLEEVELTSATRLLPGLEINWDNVTTANMDNINLNNAFRILLLAPRLKKYTISIEEFRSAEDDGSWSPLPLDLPLTHTTLESLVFDSTSRDTLAQFLQGVNFPSLKELDSYEHIFFGKSPLEHLISFVERSPCRLVSLSLFLYPTTIDHDILNLLNTLPTLTRLSIIVTGRGGALMTDGFLQELAPPTCGSPKMVMPRLETFSYTGPLDFTWPAFLKIFDPPRTFIPDGDSPVEHYHMRPLRNVSLRLHTRETLTVDDDVLVKLRGIQVTVNLKIVGLFAGRLTPIV
jgi:hypothetical protein